MKVFETVLVVLFAIIAVCAEDIDPCAVVPDNTYIGDITSCEGWIKCVDGKSSVKGKCPKGYKFDWKDGVCDVESKVDCSDSFCRGKDDTFVADTRKPKRCGAYFYCSKGKAFGDICPDGRHFSKGVCVDADPAVCKDEPSVCFNVPNKINVADPELCTSYYSCNNGVATKKDCKEPFTFFDIKTGNCTDRADIECKVVCTADGKMRDPKSCRQYYTCLDGVATPTPCDEHELVDGTDDATIACKGQIEVSDELCPNRCEGRSDPFAVAFPKAGSTPCSTYLPCVDGKVYDKNLIYKCPATYLFHDKEQACKKETEVEDRKSVV